ncbi:translocation/assembly module TamB domain-containing protein [Macromonas bipunctata]|uniref:translocation/assembly module TamB domain-containing protein n=1 Tax=Macromonas bipunctata TaxID=183670 RepID=UPI000C348F7B|nr:translocation/assembly module TamB domain-containing protein [Macromonas bipunctata]
MSHPDDQHPLPAPATAAPRHAAWWRLQLPASWLVELLLWTAGASVALLLATLVGLWWWSGQPQSLPQALQWASNLLRDPASGTSPLQVAGAQGSVRGSGRIEHLRWQHQGLDVELQQLQWRWPEALWRELLLERRLQLEQLQLQRLRLHDQSPPNPEPRQPPASVSVPWLRHISVPLQVEQIHVQGDTDITLGPLRAHYRYGPASKQPHPPGQPSSGDATDAPRHSLDIPTLHWAQGQYRLQAHVETQAPMRLHATLHGQVQTQVPGGDQALTLQAQLQLSGALGERDLPWPLRASVQPASSSPGSARERLRPELTLQAQLLPWQPLPLYSGALQLQDIDLASFWPQAPRTRLHGQWQVEAPTPPAHSATSAQPPVSAPQHANAPSTQWRLRGELHNQRPGPWDKQALPLQRLRADVELSGSTWRLHTLDADLAGGTLQAQGQAELSATAATATGSTASPADATSASNTSTPGWLQRLRQWSGQLQVRNLQPQALLSTLAVQALHLDADARTGDTATPSRPPNTAPAHSTRFSLNLRPASGSAARSGPLLPTPQLQASGHWHNGLLTLQQAQAQLWDIQAQARGTLHPQPADFAGNVTLRAPGSSATFEGRLNAATGSTNTARVQVDDAAALHRWGLATLTQLDRLLPQLALGQKIPATLQQAQLQGQAELQAQWRDTLPLPWLGAQQRSTAPGAATPAQPPDWQIALHLPQLQIRLPDATAPLQLRDWRTTLHGQRQQFNLQHHGALQATPWQADLQLQASGQLRPGGQGTALQAQLQQLELNARHDQQPLRWQARSQSASLQWHPTDGLTVPPGQLQLQPSARPGATVPAMAREPLTLAWDTTRWRDGVLTSQGRIQHLALSWLNAQLSNPRAPQGPLTQAGLSGELLFDGHWNLRLPTQASAPGAKNPVTAQAELQLQRRSGDLTLTSGDGQRRQQLRAGLSEALLRLELQHTQLQAQLRWLSQNAGQVQVRVGSTLSAPSASQPGWAWPEQAPLQGEVQASLPQLGLWSRFTPPGWRMQGSLQANAQLSGSRSRPQWQGQIEANDVALRSLLDGLEFSGGQLRASLHGERLSIDSLRLRGAGGEAGGEAGGLLLGSGAIDWSPPTSTSTASVSSAATPANATPAVGNTANTLPSSASTETAMQTVPAAPHLTATPATATAATTGSPPASATPHLPRIDLQLQAQKLRLLARADRRLTLSGDVKLQLRDTLLDLSGNLSTDQALFLLPDASTPTLGDDVVVRGWARPQASGGNSPIQTRLKVTLVLGDNFELRGKGIQTHLTGRLQFSAEPGQSVPELTGLVRTVRGSYRAYGQTLSIDNGRIQFGGPYDNPGLNILAVRPHPSQVVGVEITGTAQAPRVRLYAEPDLPDSEKLAWLVLGRPATGAGAESAVLQQAALALLSGQTPEGASGLGSRVGLDEISFQGEQINADGSTASAAAITLGKRLSNDLYLSYSRSVVGAMGTVSVLYDISQYLTLRAQAGDDNAIDLIYTHKYDGREIPPRVRRNNAPLQSGTASASP